ncbi:glutamate synthase [Oscillospiraceae bacterium MB08-C2-2]|nr:glutamate synthase [Oscillospiraceae bacterium MB08-C2-2]
MTINAEGMHFQTLCTQIKEAAPEPVVVENCMGQRYIGSGMSGADITIHGTPGNALGAYFDGGRILVGGNAQDATGDTMNDGEIIIHGSSGDATGYAMRGGKIFVKGNTGYRAGIHMKAYQQKLPVLVIGGRAGNFLGEYQAGGKIIVLGLEIGGSSPVGDFCGTGMHGGAIYIRCQQPPEHLPEQVAVSKATAEDLTEVAPEVERYCDLFGGSARALLEDSFYVLRPNKANPYKRLYTHN